MCPGIPPIFGCFWTFRKCFIKWTNLTFPNGPEATKYWWNAWAHPSISLPFESQMALAMAIANSWFHEIASRKGGNHVAHDQFLQSRPLDLFASQALCKKESLHIRRETKRFPGPPGRNEKHQQRLPCICYAMQRFPCIAFMSCYVYINCVLFVFCFSMHLHINSKGFPKSGRSPMRGMGESNSLVTSWACIWHDNLIKNYVCILVRSLHFQEGSSW